MTSISETGHFKNIANFERLITTCKTFGTTYNPAKPELKVITLTAQYDAVKSASTASIFTKNILDLAINERQITFAPLKPLATRIISALQASGATAETIDDAKSINTKIRGRRATPKAEPEEGKRTISTSQQSYDALTENFFKLATLVSMEPLYKPNEKDLKVIALQAYLQELQAANTDVIQKQTDYNTTLVLRNEALYATNTGLVDTALAVKKYVLSVYGTTSPYYKQISKLEFKRRAN